MYTVYLYVFPRPETETIFLSATLRYIFVLRSKMVISLTNLQWTFKYTQILNEPVRVKINKLCSDQARHKPGCTVTKDGYRLEILDFESREIVLSLYRKQRR